MSQGLAHCAVDGRLSAMPYARSILFVLLLLVPMKVDARLMQLSVGTTTLDVGAICALRSAKTIPAPATKDGKVGLDRRPYTFVLEEDDVPSLPDLAVGIVVRLRNFTAGESLTLQAGKIEIGVTPDTWRIGLNDDGSFWLATSPDPGTRLEVGTYRFSVFRGRDAILIYDMTVRPPTKADIDKGLCLPTVS